MQFTKRSINNFQRLYLKYFNEKLSEEEAVRKAEYLIEIYKIVHGMPSAVEFIENEIKED